MLVDFFWTWHAELAGTELFSLSKFVTYADLTPGQVSHAHFLDNSQTKFLIWKKKKNPPKQIQMMTILKQ